MATRKTSTPTAPKSTSAPKATTAKAAVGDSARGTHQPVDAIEHAADERMFIPSREEAGQEDQAIAGRPTVKAVPLNPVTTRGQDPELYWLGKYGSDDAQRQLDIDIRSLYRHEHIRPEQLIANLYRFKNRDEGQMDLLPNELHGNPLALDEDQKPGAYYHRKQKWENRLIQGDSLLVMTSLLEREGMAGQVQCIYMDPPYGIKYGSNWQMRLNDRRMPSGEPDEALSGEGEVIKAFRDTWELGIHSYLSYLRDRLLVAKELLSPSGSCFVQISDENVHLVRNVLDEVFGSESHIATIIFKKTGGLAGNKLTVSNDYLLWVARDATQVKYKPLMTERAADGLGDVFRYVWQPDGTVKTLAQLNGVMPERGKLCQSVSLTSQGHSATRSGPYMFQGKSYSPPLDRHWSVDVPGGLDRLAQKGRLFVAGANLRFASLLEDNPLVPLSNVWTDTGTGSFTEEQRYVVQTATKVIQRCILMTTDPGDLVLDPTCGSGTTAHVAEQWGRRWITSDTSRIALNIAKTRLMTATYPWYKLADQVSEDIRHGFVYRSVPSVTLKSLANDEPSPPEPLRDQPEVDKKKLRVAGPFTVETLQAFEPVPPDQIDEANAEQDNVQRFTERVFEHLRHAGIKNGLKNETAVFTQVDLINEPTGVLHAEGWWPAAEGEKKAYFHIGPQFGTVSRQSVNDAIKAARNRGDADWLVILGFGFESDIENRAITTRVGSFEVTKVRMHDDLMQDGLIKKDKKAASFVTIGEPDIGVFEATLADGRPARCVEIRGLDLYDPITDEVKPRSAADIAYWMVDDAYDGASFNARQVFFCGGDHDEFDKFKKGLASLAAASVKAKVERTLKIELDDEAFERLYGFVSHPIAFERGKRVAVRVISQFGEESTKVVVL